MKNTIITVVGLSALVIGAGTGTAIASAAGAYQPAPPPNPGQRAAGDTRPVNKTPVQRNADGKTFGASGLGETPADDPDLVLVVATNGKTGYAYSRELNGPQPSSPEEASRLPRSWTVPVYLSDGKTRIGEFKVGG